MAVVSEVGLDVLVLVVTGASAFVKPKPIFGFSVFVGVVTGGGVVAIGFTDGEEVVTGAAVTEVEVTGWVDAECRIFKPVKFNAPSPNPNDTVDLPAEVGCVACFTGVGVCWETETGVFAFCVAGSCSTDAAVDVVVVGVAAGFDFATSTGGVGVCSATGRCGVACGDGISALSSRSCPGRTAANFFFTGRVGATLRGLKVPPSCAAEMAS